MQLNPLQRGLKASHQAFKPCGSQDGKIDKSGNLSVMDARRIPSTRFAMALACILAFVAAGGQAPVDPSQSAQALIQFPSAMGIDVGEGATPTKIQAISRMGALGTVVLKFGMKEGVEIHADDGSDGILRHSKMLTDGEYFSARLPHLLEQAPR